MAVERGGSQEEINSFASLLKTFLPDHSDLPLTGSTEELLQHINESTKSESKRVTDTSLIDQLHLNGPNLEHSSVKNDQGKRGQGSSQKQPGSGCQSNSTEQQTKTSQYNVSNLCCDNSQSAQITNAGQCKPAGQLPGCCQCTARQQADSSRCDTADQLKCGCSIREHQAGKSETDEQLEKSHLLDRTVQSACGSATPEVGSSDALDTRNTGSVLPRNDKENVTSDHSLEACEHNIKHYACFVCDETFQELTPYAVHMKGHCQKTVNIKCSDCGETLSSKSSFIAHRKLSTYEIRVNRSLISNAENIDTEESSDDGISTTKRRKKGLLLLFWKIFRMNKWSQITWGTVLGCFVV